MARILLLTRHTPLPWEDGAGAYVYDVLSYLKSQGHDIHVGWLTPHDHLCWRGIWQLPPTFASIVKLHTAGAFRISRWVIFPSHCKQQLRKHVSGFGQRLLKRLGLRSSHSASRTGPASKSPTAPLWHALPSVAETNAANHFIGKIRPDVIIANYGWMTPLFPTDSNILRICLHHDVMWRRTALLAQDNIHDDPMTRSEEASLLQKADLVVAISEADAEDFHAMLPQGKILVAPKASEDHPLSISKGRRLLFVGSDNQFNVEGLTWFMNQVWPKIRAKDAHCTMDVCGSIFRLISNPPSGISLLGKVSNLEPYYARSSVVIVPLLRATGLNIKLVEAASYGRAIVTTSATLNGAPFLRESVISADNANAFSEAVLQLLNDEEHRNKLAQNGHRIIRKTLSPEFCYQPLAATLPPCR